MAERVSATPGVRSLERGGEAKASTAAHEGDRISFPSGLVEIDGQKVAGNDLALRILRRAF
jgi:hypothetical protein